MKTVELSGPASSEQAIRAGESEEVVVMRDGKPVAIVVPFDEEDLVWYATERDPQFLESIARAREEVKAGRTVSHENLKKEMGLSE